MLASHLLIAKKHKKLECIREEVHFSLKHIGSLFIWHLLCWKTTENQKTNKRDLQAANIYTTESTLVNDELDGEGLPGVLTPSLVFLL